MLPGRVVVYAVLALCLFCDDAYEEVMRKLVNGLQFLGNWVSGWQVPTSSALSQARTRLGPEPMQMLFEQVATPIAHPGTIGAWFHRWRVMAVDGVVLDAPDTEQNRHAFPRPASGAAQAPFPQVRLVGLGECGTHAIVAAEFDAAQRATERVLLARLLDTDVFTGDMLVLCDRGFYSYDLRQAAAATGADLLWRIKDEVSLPVLAVLPDGSCHSELLPRTVKSRANRAARRGHRYQVPDDTRIPIRVIEYTIPDRNGKVEKIRLITTILDYTSASSVELAALYAQRWEFELTLDEIEVHQMSATRMLRSRTPELVRQEIWAMLLVHYAVRSFMREAADDIDEDLDRMSFIRAIRVIRRQVSNQAGFSPLSPDEGNS